MCFSPEISILSYIIGILSCVLLWRSGHKPEALFYA
jgi:hypothetical protein